MGFNETRDDGVAVASAGPHANHSPSLQSVNHASNSTVTFFTRQMLFLAPNQQRQSAQVKGGGQSVAATSAPFLGLELVHAFPQSIDERFLFLLKLVLQLHFVSLELQQRSPATSLTAAAYTYTLEFLCNRLSFLKLRRAGPVPRRLNLLKFS